MTTVNPIYVGRYTSVLKCRSLSAEECEALGNPSAVATQSWAPRRPARCGQVMRSIALGLSAS